MFDTYPTYPRYRTLKLTSPMMRGEDVYALQTALAETGFSPGAHDGIYGPATDESVRAAQRFYHLVVDGLAGGATQSAIVQDLNASSSAVHKLPRGLLKGQTLHESGQRVGNYSPQRADGSYDAGVAQRNTRFTSPKEGFDAADSIEELAYNARKFYDEFTGITDARRRWGLAAGAWNAPAFARYIAREEGASRVNVHSTAKPSAESRAALENYIASVTAYLSL